MFRYGGRYPLVSALMVTQRGREEFAASAMENFDMQTYPNKELVVVHSVEPGLLGSYRNESIENARGEYLIQWDDDDVHQADRMAQQLEWCIKDDDADACFLNHETIRCHLCGWSKRVYRDFWENSMLVKKASLVKAGITYPQVGRGEDTEFLRSMRQKGFNIAVLDNALLYTYRFHGANTWGPDHFNKFFKQEGHDTEECYGRYRAASAT